VSSTADAPSIWGSSNAYCERDLEGIVGKFARGTYRTDGRATSWLKIKNPEYSQMRDRRELFALRGEETRRGRTSVRLDLELR
jgi:ATP-dependent DNA ligase